MNAPDNFTALAQRYRSFADHQALGSSPTLELWARAVADSAALQRAIASLPADKQQPNLVFAAARWHGAVPGDVDSLHHALTTDIAAITAITGSRATQTNEAARGALLALGLSQVPGPSHLSKSGHLRVSAWLSTITPIA